MIYNNSSNKKNFVNKFILQRKTRSTLNVSNISGKNKKVYIEIRKKCTYTRSISKNIQNIDLNNKDNFFHNNQKSFSIISSDIMEKEKKDRSHIEQFSALESKKLKYDIFSDKDIQYKLENKKKNQSDKNVSSILNIKQVKMQNDHDMYYQSEKDLSVTDLKNNSQKLDYKLVSTSIHDNDGNKKLHHERRYRSRIKSRNRPNNSKFIKQKRSNNYRVYDEMEINGLEKDEGTYISTCSKVNKNKRKSSILMQGFNKPVKKVVRNIIIGETISVLELANKMSVKGTYVIKVMMQLGLIVTINQILDQETAQLVIEEMGHKVVLRHENILEEYIMRDRNNKIDDKNLLEKRAPVVTIMGHVDHGKTSLLDCIRSTKIASSEIGGITQKLGVYHVNTENGMITFLDTPGHAAFTTMRARGVRLTDLVVLVVAADDGVMPQTIEAIQHIKTVKVPVVVAINKIDKIGSNVERIKNDLSNYGLVPEEWGGNTQYVNVSAILGNGIDNLLDAILLQAEILELKVSRHGMGSAVVIESYLDKGRGPAVIVLVREGILKCGDMILCGTEYGRIRAMRDEFGCNITSAGPSIPVELLGLSGTPISGEIAITVRDEKKAREVALYRKEKLRELKLAQKKESNVKNIFIDMKQNIVSELNLIVKSDTQGSLEAICESLLNLSTDKIVIKILSSSIGEITETDAVLASTCCHSIILGFNVRADFPARRIIEINKLNVHYYSVIYDLLHSVKQIINSIIPVNVKCKYEPIGLAKVRNVFHVPKYGNIAGCIVINGFIKCHKKIRVIRNNVIIYEGLLESLRHFKNDVIEVQNGMECGIGIKDYNDVKFGDIIEVFDI